MWPFKKKTTLNFNFLSSAETYNNVAGNIDNGLNDFSIRCSIKVGHLRFPLYCYFDQAYAEEDPTFGKWAKESHFDNSRGYAMSDRDSSGIWLALVVKDPSDSEAHEVLVHELVHISQYISDYLNLKGKERHEVEAYIVGKWYMALRSVMNKTAANHRSMLSKNEG